MEENYIEGPERGGCVDGQCSIEEGAKDSEKGTIEKGTIEKGTLKGLFSLMKQTDIFINLGI